MDKGQLLGESGDPNLALLWTGAGALKLAPPEAAALQAAIRLSMGSWKGQVNAVRWALPHDGPLLSVAFGRGGELVTVSDKLNAPFVVVRRWDPASGRSGVPVTLELEGVILAVLTPDGGHVLLGTLDGLLQLHNLATGKLAGSAGRCRRGVLRRVQPGTANASVVGYATGPRDAYRRTGRAQVYEMSTGTPRGPPLEHARPVPRGRVPPGRPKLRHRVRHLERRYGRACAARFFDVDGREVRPAGHAAWRRPSPSAPTGASYLPGTGIAWRGSGPRRADGRETRRPATRGPGRQRFVQPGRRDMMTAAYDGSVRLWDASGRLLGPPIAAGTLGSERRVQPGRLADLGRESGKRRPTMESSAQPCCGAQPGSSPAAFPLAISPDGRTILTQDADLSVRIRDAITNAPLGKPLQHHRPVLIGGTSILPGQRSACSSDRSLRLTVEEDTVAKLWNTESGELIADLKGDPEFSTFFAAAFSPDGRVLVTGNFLATAYLWDAKTGKRLREVKHNDGGTVFNIAFGADGRTFLTGGDIPVRFWNLDTGEQLGQPLMHHTPVFALALSPDGRTAVTGDVDRNVQLWDVSAHVDC